MNQFANGKLLLTNEYLVLDGAEALSLPTSHGQYLFTNSINENVIKWTAYDLNYEIWLNVLIDKEGKIIETNNKSKSEFIQKIFSYLYEQGKLKTRIHHKSYLTFDGEWGLGSSSTLTSLIADYYKTDVFKLLENTFGGSGYDVATANSKSAILYSNINGNKHTSVEFNPPYKKHIAFIYLNKKQDSREGISMYKNLSDKRQYIEEVNILTHQILLAKDQKEAINLFIQHENIISKVIHQPKVQDVLFSDFGGVVKSLGAWGGDYVMAIHPDKSYEGIKEYFRKKSFNICFSYDDLIL